jgi:hypothetical protein
MKPILAGLIFGVVDVCLMLPMPFPDKRTAFWQHSVAGSVSGKTTNSRDSPFS